MSIVVALIIVLAILCLYLHLLKFNYWKNRKVTHIKPTAFFGNYRDAITLKKPRYAVSQEICKQFPDASYIGTYFGTEPALLVQDLDLIRLIMAKDYGFFSGREVVKYADREILTRNMFFTYGDKWKVLRQNTSPLFTISKMKKMFPLIQKCIVAFENMLDYETSVSDVLETRPLMVRYTMDCIGSCGFGFETETMSRDIVENPFRKIGDLIFENSNARGLASITRAMWPSVFYALGLVLFPIRVYNFFHSVILDVFKHRDFKPSMRHDFVDSMLELRKSEYLTCESVLASKKGEKISVKINDDLLVSQCMLFFAAGFETSSNAMNFTLYHLAKNQDAQNRVEAEIDEYLRRKNGIVEYDCVTKLPFLDACIDEAMRLCPALGLITREVMEPYELPSGLILDKGLRVHIPVYHLHYHPDHFPEPEKYKPERFLPENKSNIKQYSYLPFGGGQRECIGKRVAKMQMLAGLITLLKKFRVEMAEGTPEHLIMEPRAVITQAKENFRLKFVRKSIK